MKAYYSSFLFVTIAAFLLLGGRATCQVIPELEILESVSYGDDPQQNMDIYLPGGRDPSVTKTVVLIHGGGWSAGFKADMNDYLIWFNTTFPRYAIVNLEYRLANVTNPGMSHQLDDIGLALQHLTAKQQEYGIQATFGLVGHSAGSHLSLLYGYSVDKGHNVRVICNIVGPSDFSDPSYADFPATNQAIQNFVGNYSCLEKPTPEVCELANPIHHITNHSPRTISFYGGVDAVVPVTQGPILENVLDSVGVLNKYYFYPDEGHVFVNPVNILHQNQKMYYFFRDNL